MSEKKGRSGGAASERDRKFRIGLARAFGGAIFFSLPMLMTMELWSLGFYMDRLRLALFMALMVPFLIVLDHYSGFEETTSWGEDAMDGMVAYGVGFVASGTVLPLIGIIDHTTPLREIVGMVSLQAIPAGFGAVLASSQLRGEDGGQEDSNDRERRSAGYAAEIFFMATGAVFLAFNLAPTEEVILIAYSMTPWHGVALALVTLAMMHAFVYAVSFRGAPSPRAAAWSVFFRFTVVGYAVSLLIAAYVLWTFGRLEATPTAVVAMYSVVLAFPGGLGAAAARLIL